MIRLRYSSVQSEKRVGSTCGMVRLDIVSCALAHTQKGDFNQYFVLNTIK